MGESEATTPAPLSALTATPSWDWIVGIILAVIAAVVFFIAKPRLFGGGDLGAELGAPADPSEPYSAARPEWYFLAMFHTLKLIPSHVLGFEGERLGVIAFGLVAIFLVFVPFVDRRSSDGRGSPWFTALAVAGVLYLVIFTILAQIAR